MHFARFALTLRLRNNMKREKTDNNIVLAPFDESLPPQKRMETVIELSQLVTKIVTYVICYTIVNHEELFNDERKSIAHAFLQRVTTTHMCNHKLTEEGLVYKYNGESFHLHEEYKTMTLTRTVYEHLAMFYFLYEHPKTAEERDLVWKYWKINSKKNLLDYHAEGESSLVEEQQKIQEELKLLRDEILASPLGKTCYAELAEWTKPRSRPHNGSIEFVWEKGEYAVRKVPFSQAWKYLFRSEDMALMYRHLSMHCHPEYNGLLQFQHQSASVEGEDCIPLYLSCSFLAILCRLFLKMVPKGRDVIKGEFSQRDQSIFYAISQMFKE